MSSNLVNYVFRNNGVTQHAVPLWDLIEFMSIEMELHNEFKTYIYKKIIYIYKIINDPMIEDIKILLTEIDLQLKDVNEYILKYINDILIISTKINNVMINNNNDSTTNNVIHRTYRFVDKNIINKLNKNFNKYELDKNRFCMKLVLYSIMELINKLKIIISSVNVRNDINILKNTINTLFCNFF